MYDDIDSLTNHFQNLFDSKVIEYPYRYPDKLMQMFGLTPGGVTANIQFYNSRLGEVWEQLTGIYYRQSRSDYKPKYKLDDGTEPWDHILTNTMEALDAKYSLRSRDNKYHKALIANANRLMEMGYTPIMLIYRSDSFIDQSGKYLRRKFEKAGWVVFEGDEAMQKFFEQTGVDLDQVLDVEIAKKYKVAV